MTAHAGRLIVRLIAAIRTDGLSIVLGECGARQGEGKEYCQRFFQTFSSSIGDSIWSGYRASARPVLLLP
jgi:hypothetical protein